MKLFNVNKLIFFVIVLSYIGCGGGGVNTTEPNNDLNTKDTNLETKSKNQQSESKKNDTEDKIDNISFNFYIKRKKEFIKNHTITTNYEYDNNGYLIKSIRKDNTTDDISTREYKYFENHRVLKIYEDENLIKIAIFIPKQKDQDSKISISNTLSVSDKKKYLYHTFDTITKSSNLKVQSIITDIEHGLDYAQKYVYDKNETLISIKDGHFNLDNEVQLELFSETNTSFLLEQNATLMPFEVSQAQNYIYQNQTLKKIEFDNNDDGSIEVSSDVNITYYPSGIIKNINISTGDKWNYNINGILTSSKSANGASRVYTYSDDYKTVTVKDGNGKLVKEYRFEEIKGGN